MSCITGIVQESECVVKRCDILADHRCGVCPHCRDCPRRDEMDGQVRLRFRDLFFGKFCYFYDRLFLVERFICRSSTDVWIIRLLDRVCQYRGSCLFRSIYYEEKTKLILNCNLKSVLELNVRYALM